MNIVALIIQLISGAAGGNVAGSIVKDMSLGPVGNSIVGAIGGVACGQLLATLAPAIGAALSGGSLDLGTIVGQIAGGGVGGAVVVFLVGLVKSMMSRSA